jgi:hypothetical protein
MPAVARVNGLVDNVGTDVVDLGRHRRLWSSGRRVRRGGGARGWLGGGGGGLALAPAKGDRQVRVVLLAGDLHLIVIRGEERGLVAVGRRACRSGVRAAAGRVFE